MLACLLIKLALSWACSKFILGTKSISICMSSSLFLFMAYDCYIEILCFINSSAICCILWFFDNLFFMILSISKNELYALKRLHKPSFKMTKQVRIEVRQIR